jgi:hypothetical protein
MANNQNLKDSITGVIKQNGTNSITGDLLQTALLSIINQFGANREFAGVAVPATVPGAPDANVFYLASTVGNYVNFSASVIAEGELYMFINNPGWTPIKIFSIDTSKFLTSDYSDFGGRFATTDQANAAIPNTVVNGKNQRDAKIVYIGSTGNYVPYWWKGGTTDFNLVRLIDVSGLESINSPTGTQLFSKTKNIIYPDTQLGSSGVLVPGNLPGSITVRVPIMPSKGTLVISGLVGIGVTGSKYRRFADATGALIAGSVSVIGASTHVATIPTNAAYLDFSPKLSADPATAMDAVMINYGQAALPFAAYEGIDYVKIISGILLSASKLENNSKMDVSGDEDSSIANKAKVKEIISNTSPSTNLLLNDRWAKGISTLDVVVATRFTKNDGFNYSTDIVYSIADAYPLFGYVGKSVNAKITGTAQNFLFFVTSKKILLDPNYIAAATGNVYVNMELISNFTGNLVFKIWRVTGVSTETELNAQTIPMVAGVVKKVTFPAFSLLGGNTEANTLGFEIRIHTAGGVALNQSIDIGRVMVSTVSTTDLESKTDYPIILRGVGVPGGTDVKMDFFATGDSLMTTELPTLLAALAGRNIVAKGYGGQKSFQIRKHFIDENLAIAQSKVNLIWVGRNNIADPGAEDVVVSDVRDMVALIPHKKFIVMGVTNGEVIDEYKNGSRYNRMIKINDHLQAAYGVNYIDIRRHIIENYDYGGVRLVDAFVFVQPAINANVQILVNKTSFFAVNDPIAIGYFSSADKYTVVSIDSATAMTIKLITSNRIAPGGNVGNDFYDFTQTGTVYPSYGYLKVIKDVDFLDYNYDTTPSTGRIDGIHFNATVNQLIADCVYRRMVALNF